MSLSIFWMIVYPFINVAAFLFTAKEICKVKYPFILAAVCLGFEIVIPFIIAFAGSVFSFSSQIPTYIVVLFHPLFLYWYFSKVENVKKYLSIFLAFFLYLAVNASNTFFAVIVSSVLQDDFVAHHFGLFLTIVHVTALIFMVKLISLFDFRIIYLKDSNFKSQVLLTSSVYAGNYLVLNISHWLSHIKYFNSFSGMVATICFLTFLSTMLIFKESREKYEKEEQIRQRELEQLQLQKYTDEIVALYNEIKGFRHDYAGMLTSMRMAIQTGDIEEIDRIYQEVLLDANLNLRSDKYTIFDLNNVGDSALKSVMAETFFKAREHSIDLTFEVKDAVDRLPIRLLDIVRIASILLNNAIESAIESYDKFVHVSLVQLDSKIIFVVKNSRKTGELDLEEIYQPGFSTKGEKRGLGLSNMKNILDSYEFITLDTEIDTHDFTQILTIRRKEQL
ncbi:competence system sensor histidine kinase ComD [Streptococcus panodentis]|uniref:ATP-binding protein n=1 Tax=Streptococcus panodentis TaxID=1581472 RepID=A0ABS5AUS9_9STRE|nr:MULTISPECIES: competence system sensor histidine kinase ComD [Streptococcus]KXT84893.1 Histidine kinase of the competence regulon ComD [Streptococcus sp. DD11]MBP2620235.1 ATP-binding protein [Streptococcus panodentis]